MPVGGKRKWRIIGLLTALAMLAAGVAYLLLPDPAARLAVLDPHRFCNDPAAQYDPALGFRLKKSVSMYGFRHNAAGFVGDELGPKPPGAVRIVCLGGSTTLGAGVPTDRLAYPSILQAIFDKTTGGTRRVEVLNAGLFGYHSLHTALRLGELEGVSPDVYVVMDGLNDLDVARTVPLAVLERARLGRGGAWLRDAVRRLAEKADWSAARVPGMGGIEEKWRMVGYKDNLALALDAAARQGVAALLVSDPMRLEPAVGSRPGDDAEQAALLVFGQSVLPAANAALARRAGVKFLDVQPVFDAHLTAPARIRRVWADRLHLTRYGYYLLAREVYRTLLAYPSVRQALAGVAPLDDASLDAAFPELVLWQPGEGSGWSRARGIPTGGFSRENARDSAPDGEGWSCLVPSDPAGPAVVVLDVPETVRTARLYPRIQGRGDVVTVQAVGMDGSRRDLFAMAKDYDDGLWSPQTDWFDVAMPPVPVRRLEIRLVGENAQLWHRGEAMLFEPD